MNATELEFSTHFLSGHLSSLSLGTKKKETEREREKRKKQSE